MDRGALATVLVALIMAVSGYASQRAASKATVDAARITSRNENEEDRLKNKIAELESENAELKKEKNE